jgi:hypothetical protein
MPVVVYNPYNLPETHPTEDACSPAFCLLILYSHFSFEQTAPASQ